MASSGQALNSKITRFKQIGIINYKSFSVIYTSTNVKRDGTGPDKAKFTQFSYKYLHRSRYQVKCFEMFMRPFYLSVANILFINRIFYSGRISAAFVYK